MGKHLDRNKSTSKRKQGCRNKNRLILVVSEGEKTEKFYFEWLKQKLRLYSTAIIETIGVGGDPETVVDTAIDEYHRRKKVDMVYCLVDRDNHPLGKYISAKEKFLRKEYRVKFRFILSYPCIEYWFKLHFDESNRNSHARPYAPPSNGSIGRVCKSELKEQYPYYDEGDKIKLDNFFSAIYPKTCEAIEKAKQIIDQNLSCNTTINPSTLMFIPMVDIILQSSDCEYKEQLRVTYKQYLDEVTEEFINQQTYEQYIFRIFELLPSS